MMTYENIKGEYPVFDYEQFIPAKDEPFPDNRILDFLTVGPFVLHTDGSFEAEHMYERQKLLLEDYLLADGGEKSIVPVLGGKVRNKYYGDEYLYWKKGFIKWNCLRFDSEEDACDPALYETQQRNAVFYAAFYIRCKNESNAVICYENSGSSLFVNGEEQDFRPFGRVKGLWGFGFQCPVTLQAGLNLIMFKIRPGYIADSMDIVMANCSVFPVILENEGFALTSPSVTFAYSGEKGNENQLFPVFVHSREKTEGGRITYSSGEIALPPMEKDEIRPFRFEIPAKEKGVVVCPVSVGNKTAEFFFPVTPYDGYEGREFVYSDFHFDTTYHQEQRTYALGAFHITRSIIERLIDNPDFKATLSEIDYLHPYYSLYPEHREVMRKSFSEGRAEADCFYNQPNDLTSSGEAFVRNLIYGQLYHRDVMGRLSTVYCPGDVFGHFSQMTQVCKKGGCDYIKWGKMMLGVDSLFRHVSPDGTSLLHDKGMNRAAAERLGVTGCDPSSDALSYIDAFPREGDTSWMKNTVTKASFAVFSDLAREVNESASRGIKSGENTEILYSSRDLTQHHSGVILTRTDFKQANRLCENLLSAAEKFSSVAFMYGAKYPDKALDKAVRQLLCAQHHDSITGTNNEISFIDLMIEYRECASLLCDIIEKACSFIAGGVKTENREDSVFVFNPLTWDRGGKVWFNIPEKFKGAHHLTLTDIRGQEYTAAAEGERGWFISKKLPAMGYSVFKIREKAEEPVIKGKDAVIENRFFRLEVDASRGGSIVSLYDKAHKRELIDKAAPAPANTVYVMKEIHDRMETQHELYTTGHKLLSSEYEADVRSEKCSLYQKLYIRVKLDTVAVLLQEITLYKNADTVDFITKVEDYQAEDDLFSVTFPMDIKGGAVIFDDRFAPHISTRSKKYMSFQTHQYASFSGCRVLPVNRWFGVGPSFTVNMNGNASFNVGMTAVIRTEDKIQRDAADRVLFALTKKAVPVTLYSDREQHGGMKIIHYNEDVYSTDTRIVLSLLEDKNEYKEKLLSSLKAKTAEKIEKTVNNNGVAVCYFKDNDNVYKKYIDVLLVISKDEKHLGEFAGALEEACVKGRQLDIGGVITECAPERADDFGCVLINNGTPASSVEGKATLNMMLFHTAAFYGNQGRVTGEKELVPERKSHIFTYSLYPHSGFFDKAGVYEKAFEFNEAPYAVTGVKEAENTPLPEEKAFLRSPAGFSVTAFKAAGYPYANLRNVPASPEERGFVIRGFENSGLSGKAVIKTDFTVLGAYETDLLEENPSALKASGDSVTLSLTPYSIKTALMKTAVREKIGSAVIGKEKEEPESVYIRSWEHDTGSSPMGNLTFAATIERLPAKGEKTEVLFINAVNNSLSEKIKTEIRVVCSDNISADKNIIPVEIESSGSVRIPLEITYLGDEYKGQVKIFYTYDSMEFYDVYEAGLFEPEVSLSIGEKEITVKMNNPTGEILTGALYIASPFETWGGIIPDENVFGDISPDTHFVELKAFEEKIISVPYSMKNDMECSFWAAAKLAVNGRIYFAFDKKLGMRHNVWAHEFFSEITESNGSIRAMLEM